MRRSGPAALDEARVQADVPDVVSVQQPGEEALQAQTVAAVGTRAVLPLQRRRTGSSWIKPGQTRQTAEAHLVRVPVVGSRVDPLPLVSLQELLRVPDTHRAADDLPDVRHQHVHLGATTRNRKITT